MFYIVEDDTKTTVGIKDDCSQDAIKTIKKRYNDKKAWERAIIHKDISCTTNLADGDEYDEIEGKNIAMDKMHKSHKKQVRNAIIRWQQEMLKAIQRVSPETFQQALDTTDFDK